MAPPTKGKREEVADEDTEQVDDDPGEQYVTLPTEEIEATKHPDGYQKRAFFLDAEEMKGKVREALSKPTYNVFDWYHETGCFQRLARCAFFEHVTLFVINVNAVWMAYDTNYNKASSLVKADLQFQIAENFFCLYFSFEWFIRFMAFKKKCNGLRDGWFVFDSLLVFMMVGETWVLSAWLLFGPESGEGLEVKGNTSILRLFRLLRLSRLARMLRSMPELMILIKGMVAATRSVFFVMCLLIIIMYVFSIAFTQLAKGTEMGAYYFPTVIHSMYSLLVYGTFLDNLSLFTDEVGSESYLCLALIFVFVLLAACTVLNMLIGVLCEVVSAVASVETEEMLVLFVTNQLQSLARAIDKNHDGYISKVEFMQILNSPEAARCLHQVGVDPVSIIEMTDEIFTASDTVVSESGEKDVLTFEKFMEGLLNLRTTNKATVRDIVALRGYVSGHLSQMIQKCRGHCLSAAKRVQKPSALKAQRGKTTKGSEGEESEKRGVTAKEMQAMETRLGKMEDMMEIILKELRDVSSKLPPATAKTSSVSSSPASSRKSPSNRRNPPPSPSKNAPPLPEMPSEGEMLVFARAPTISKGTVSSPSKEAPLLPGMPSTEDILPRAHLLSPNNMNSQASLPPQFVQKD
eukprot:TRINITY_DN63010_c0_g1_i1.p1 TRINITY_DN63010_c0_g1~~TRINITY_DN63010_c0_g1_i1.p1  ORF type:complete len:633 (+),score=146.33 TRINITY_DN63010_c0_g1_i1:98-1996(+)